MLMMEAEALNCKSVEPPCGVSDISENERRRLDTSGSASDICTNILMLTNGTPMALAVPMVKVTLIVSSRKTSISLSLGERPRRERTETSRPAGRHKTSITPPTVRFRMPMSTVTRSPTTATALTGAIRGRLFLTADYMLQPL